MTRHSPSEAALGENPVSGLHANFTLLSAFNDAVGKEVLLELVDGSVFTGIFGGASSEMEVGLYCAYEKTADNEKNLLPLKRDIVQKRQFAFSDIVCVTVPTNDEKIIKGFATDRDYHNKRRIFDDEDELEVWEGDGEDVDLESDEAVKAARTTAAAARNGGWGVNEMFAANQSLGVKTTFEDNLSQYTTAEVEGTDDDRKRADEIARQIEKSGSSRMYSALENDDEERDLDKITDEADLMGGYETRNKNNWSNGSSTTPASAPSAPSTPIPTTTTNQNGSNALNGSASISATSQLNGTSPRIQPLMTTAPPGFTPVINGHRRKSAAQHDQSHNTYLPLANRGGMNNNGRGGAQITPKNNRAEGLKGDTRRPSNSGGQGGQGQGGYVKRDSYDGGQGGQGHNNYDNWNTKGTPGMKTYENTKMRDQQKMMLENRNTPPSNSPRNSTGGPPSGPSTPHNQKGGASGRVEGLKAWQNDFNPSYRETRPMQKGQGEKMDSPLHPTPLLESVPPTKNAWQHGPPSGLTSSSKSEDSKSGVTQPSLPSPSNASPTPAEMKMAEEREVKEDAGASTSNDGEKTTETSANETKEDADVSKDSNKKSTSFSFNPDAPAFTPKFGGGGVGGGGGMVTPSLPQQMNMMQNVTVAPTLIPQGMAMQGQMGMGGMGGMQPVYPGVGVYAGQPQYPIPSNIQYSAVVNGGGIMPGAAQNGQGQMGGGAPTTPRGVQGGQGGQGGMGQAGIRQQRPGGNGGGGQGQTGGNVSVPMQGAVFVQPMAYQHMAQQNYMQPQPYANYATYPTQNTQMIQGAYAMQMGMQQQGMMGQPQRPYPQPPHQGMMMQYNMQQPYGGGPPPGVNPQQQGGVPQGGGVTPSVSTTNGGPPTNGNGGGQGGTPNVHPPSQPPTPGAVQPSGGVPPQGGMMPSQGGPPGMVTAPVHSPGMYGGMYAQPQPVMYYNQAGGGQMSGIEIGGGGGQMGQGGMHGGDGGGQGQGQETQQMHAMYQQYPGQYYATAPPHMRAQYSNMNQSMQQQQQQHVPAQPSQSQN